MLGNPDNWGHIDYDPGRIISPRQSAPSVDLGYCIVRRYDGLKAGDIFSVSHAGRPVFFRLVADGDVSIAKWPCTWPAARWRPATSEAQDDDANWNWSSGVEQVGFLYA